MGLKITDVMVSTSRKRIDGKAAFEVGLFNIFDNSEEYTADFRIVSPTEIPVGEEEEFLRQIHQRRNTWQPGKKNQFVRLDNGITGYILNYKPMEAETQKDEAL